MIKIKLSPMSRRLMPLYIAALLQGIPFWYAIEKLFMLSIGFNTVSIGLMVAIMSIVMLAVETPSGIMADRWSRKGVMILGALSLLISGILGSISFNVPTFISYAVFWGVYAALYSGTYDAVIYDTTIEEYGDSQKFQLYHGRFRAVEGISFVIGALSGGLIAGGLSMRSTFIFSLPFLLLAMYFLLKFREPQIHKAEVTEPVFKHIRQTFSAVLKKPVLLPVVIAIVGFSILQDTLFELSQLWFIAAAAPVTLYGLLSAAVYSSWSTGGLLAARITGKRSTASLLLIVLLCTFGLVIARDYWWILVAQFVLAVCLVALSIILAKKLHDELPSRLRAGSASVVSTVSRLILIPGTILFTIIANNNSVFTATYVLLAFAVIASLAYLFIPYAKRRSAV